VFSQTQAVIEPTRAHPVAVAARRFRNLNEACNTANKRAGLGSSSPLGPWCGGPWHRHGLHDGGATRRHALDAARQARNGCQPCVGALRRAAERVCFESLRAVCARPQHSSPPSISPESRTPTSKYHHAPSPPIYTPAHPPAHHFATHTTSPATHSHRLAHTASQPPLPPPPQPPPPPFTHRRPRSSTLSAATPTAPATAAAPTRARARRSLTRGARGAYRWADAVWGRFEALRARAPRPPARHTAATDGMCATPAAPLGTPAPRALSRPTARLEPTLTRHPGVPALMPPPQHGPPRRGQPSRPHADVRPPLMQAPSGPPPDGGAGVPVWCQRPPQPPLPPSPPPPPAGPPPPLAPPAGRS
jgi:hypothetical protein